MKIDKNTPILDQMPNPPRQVTRGSSLLNRVISGVTKVLYGSSAGLGGYVGSTYGQGLAVRVGTQWIYERVSEHAGSGVIGLMTGHIAGNTAAGAAVPYLTIGGGVTGGAVGAALGTGLSYFVGKVVCKIVSLTCRGVQKVCYVAKKFFLLKDLKKNLRRMEG